MKVLAIGTSNSKNSINRTLAAYTAGLVVDAEVDIVDINEYEMPLFSVERESLLGHPPEAKAFFEKIANADAIVVSVPEHNGTYTAAYKNLFDWTSRINKEVFQHKPALFLSTSPGPGGAASVLAAAVNSAGYYGAEVVASVSVPSFHNNFDDVSKRITHDEIRQELTIAANRLRQRVLRTQTTIPDTREAESARKIAV